MDTDARRAFPRPNTRGRCRHRKRCALLSALCNRKLTDVVEEVSASTVKISKETMALESRITQEEIKKEPEKPIDREKVDHMLLSTSWFTCILISH